jgi:hypothetical protein
MSENRVMVLMLSSMLIMRQSSNLGNDPDNRSWTRYFCGLCGHARRHGVLCYRSASDTEGL